MSAFDESAEWESIDSILQPDEDEYEWVKADEPSAFVAAGVALLMFAVVFGSFAFMLWVVR